MNDKIQLDIVSEAKQMSKVNILNFENSIVGELELDPYVFGCDYMMDEPRMRFRPVHEVIRWQMNKQREAIQCVKNRSGVSGAHRKIHAQKETSKARQGDGKACHFRGGGRAFKINSRNYEFKLNKQYLALAKRIVLTHKCLHGGILVIEDLAKCELSKTKNTLSFLENIGQKRVLFVTDLYGSKEMKGIENLYRVDAIPPTGLNVKSMLDRLLIFDLKSINEVQQNLLKKSKVKDE